MESPFVATSSPQVQSGTNTHGIMLDMLIALMPAAVASVLLFGWRSAGVIVVCVASCIASEYLSRLVLKRPQTVGDLSAAVTGVLLAFNLPPTIHLWQAAIGGAVAVIVVKQMFGGLGQNFVNPALVGRIVLLVNFPTDMNKWMSPLQDSGMITSATPLALLHNSGASLTSLKDLFFGIHSGCLGETCMAALLLGGVYLLIRRVITPLIPLTYIGTVFLLTWLLGQSPLTQILSGSLMLGAIFMATDPTTTPKNTASRVIFAVGCGLLTVLIRLYGSLPEGVPFAIVLMNILVPLIEKAPSPLPFWEKITFFVKKHTVKEAK